MRLCGQPVAVKPAMWAVTEQPSHTAVVLAGDKHGNTGLEICDLLKTHPREIKRIMFYIGAENGHCQTPEMYEELRGAIARGYGMDAPNVFFIDVYSHGLSGWKKGFFDAEYTRGVTMAMA